ncbi:GNAT family N-acetyltransferase [Streptococcus orisasini]|uniref:GNAT family N-acetyltransferase n=1 Tax=Streptococcus orisasini TaxID=1080071 RepID=UPI00070A9C6C|nr:GNAT family N-acetyltransferase [Streptococcus orisasini]
MEFKRIRETDLLACTAAFIDIFNDEPWYDEWTFEGAKQYISDFYKTPNFLGILAVENGEIIGFIYGVTRAWWSGKEFYIHEMGVKKAWRNQGIGTALLERLAQALEGRNVDNFALLTDRGMPAEEFYKKNGFKEIERLVFYSRDLLFPK